LYNVILLEVCNLLFNNIVGKTDVNDMRSYHNNNFISDVVSLFQGVSFDKENNQVEYLASRLDYDIIAPADGADN
jgi:hypothetical protein